MRDDIFNFLDHCHGNGMSRANLLFNIKFIEFHVSVKIALSTLASAEICLRDASLV